MKIGLKEVKFYERIGCVENDWPKLNSKEALESGLEKILQHIFIKL